MARRRQTVKRIDPWSVLKFGFVANVVLLAIFLMFMGVVWFIIDRLQLVDQVCGIATDVGFTQCGINAGNLFQSLILLGLLWVVIQTAVLVFLAFLYNLISDLTGGLTLTILDDSIPAAAATTPRQVATAGHQPGATGSSARAGSSPSTQGTARPARRQSSTEEVARRGAPVAADASTRAPSDDDLFGGR